MLLVMFTLPRTEPGETASNKGTKKLWVAGSMVCGGGTAKVSGYKNSSQERTPLAVPYK
jgi:hypothetical protein